MPKLAFCTNMSQNEAFWATVYLKRIKSSTSMLHKTRKFELEIKIERIIIMPVIPSIAIEIHNGLTNSKRLYSFKPWQWLDY